MRLVPIARYPLPKHPSPRSRPASHAIITQSSRNAMSAPSPKEVGCRWWGRGANDCGAVPQAQLTMSASQLHRTNVAVAASHLPEFFFTRFFLRERHDRRSDQRERGKGGIQKCPVQQGTCVPVHLLFAERGTCQTFCGRDVFLFPLIGPFLLSSSDICRVHRPFSTVQSIIRPHYLDPSR
jgi:hypothetical protein